MNYTERDGQVTMKGDFHESVVKGIRQVNADLTDAIDLKAGLGLEFIHLRVQYLADRNETEEKIKEAQANIDALRKQKRQLIAAAKALDIDVDALLGSANVAGDDEGGDEPNAEAEG